MQGLIQSVIRGSILWLVLVWSPYNSAAELAIQRLDFLHAEHLLAGNKEDEFLAVLEKLQDYPLYPYLKAQWLKAHLDQSEQVTAFLQHYADTRYAQQIRVPWLAALAKQQRWQEIIANFHDSDNVASQCLFDQARYLTGQKEAALTAAQQLWLLGEDLPAECDFLLETFKVSAHFSKDLVWTRFDVALQKNQVSLAKYLTGFLDKEGQGMAEFWLQLHDKPELVQSDKLVQMPIAYQGAMFAYAVQRMAKKDPLSAIMLWDGRAANLSVEPTRLQQLERKLALALANNKLPGAYARLMRVSPADEEIQEWRVRASLQEQDWQHVVNSITVLTAAEQSKPKWQYWLARAKAELGEKETALNLFKQLATKADYYGFLAADHAQMDYAFVDRPVQVDPGLKTALLTRDDFKIVQELKYHQREYEAKKQWWHIVKKLDKQQVIAAAKIAEDWQWRQIAIFTLAKTDQWDDLSLRFPVLFEQPVLENAAQQALDPSVVFGLIRQESVFDQEAASPVGARGLMQIMPATGRQIARELQEPWVSARSLFDPVLNIKYGVFYYSKLLQRFNGHFALAAAAYNAGPHRVSGWLPPLAGVAADVWVETIPFKETRHYVTAVLSYALIYQKRLQRSGLKMHDLMQEVVPL